MRKAPNFLERLFSAIQRRLPRQRRGSVLILVVVLLVLMALMGTAFMSTTRNDVTSAGSNAVNTQVDLIADGAARAAIANIVNGVFNPADPAASSGYGYREANTTLYNPSTFASCYHPYDFAGNVNYNAVNPGARDYDSFLADRVPVYTTGGTQPGPIWNAVSGPILGTFEDPTNTTVLNGTSPSFNTATLPFAVQPISSSPTGGNAQLPAFYNPSTFGHCVAGDADGDGIADCFLSRLPGVSVGGLTWYAGVRVVDNAAAINVNTAWSRNSDFDSAGNVITNFGFFPGNTGLLEMLNPYSSSTEIGNLNSYRFGQELSGNGASTPTASLTPYDESFSPAVQRPDFNYISQADALYHSLGRRLNNPGLNYNSGTNSTFYFNAIPESEMAVLAHNFCIIRPPSPLASAATIASTNGDESLLERDLFYSTYREAGSTSYAAYPTQPYEASAFGSWFYTNFDFQNNLGASTPNVMPIRALLVTHNGVSNYIAQKSYPAPFTSGSTVPVAEPINTGGYNNLSPETASMLPYPTPYTTSASGSTSPVYMGYAGEWNAYTAYNFNDVVDYNGTTYIAVANVPAGTNPTANVTVGTYTGPPYWLWQYQPYTTDGNSVKANINTATFRELWRAFWSSMCGPVWSAGSATSSAGTNDANETAFGSASYVSGLDQEAFGSSAIISTASNGAYQYQFRSSLRDTRYTDVSGGTAGASFSSSSSVIQFDSSNMLQLRSALAAVNALALRTPPISPTLNLMNRNVVSRTIQLNAWTSATPNSTAALVPVNVSVFSGAPQPYITEVYATTDTKGGVNTNGYVAIELYNPYNTDIDLTNWQLGLINRSNVAGSLNLYPASKTILLGTAPGDSPFGGFSSLGSHVVKANGYLILESSSIANRPTDVNSITPSSTVMLDSGVSALTDVIQGGTDHGGTELVLLRPRAVDPTTGLSIFTESDDPNNYYNEGTTSAPNPDELAPVDSYDFTGLAYPSPSATPPNAFEVIHYVRDKGVVTNGPNYAFKCVYPGRYQPRESLFDGGTVGATGDARQEGTQSAAWAKTGGTEPAITQACAFGMASAGTYANNFAPIQISNQDWPGPTPSSISSNAYPFGSFARNGDMLQIPYIGAYRVRLTDATLTTPGSGSPSASTSSVIEVNSPPMDASFADDADSTNTINDDPAENVGRFCPISFAVGAVTSSTLTSITDKTYRTETVLGNDPAPFASWSLTVTDSANLTPHTQTVVIQSYSPTTQTFTFNPSTPLVGGAGPAAGSLYYLTPPANSAAGVQPSSASYFNASTYDWTKSLFDYLTVQAPSDDYLPNVDPSANSEYWPTAGPYSSAAYHYAPSNAVSPNAYFPSPVMNNSVVNTDQRKDDRATVQGLVNINTAPLAVLKMLPFIPASIQSPALTAAQLDTADGLVAQAIINYRNQYGPFRSIIDLNNVFDTNYSYGAIGHPPFFATMNYSLPLQPSNADGEIAPISSQGSPTTPPYFPYNLNSNPPATTDGVYGDFLKQFLTFDRVSNLITVRSDSYTVYVVVQGWQNLNTASASPVMTKRVAYIVDRSGITSTNRTPKLVRVPQD
jgi:DNA uptake protein ComE-like DNA-binding protein